MDRSQSLSKPRSRELETQSPKRRLLAFLLCFFFGFHRFYVGKFWTGALFVLTAGGLGIWWLVDLVFIAFGRFRDSEGRVLGPARERPRRLPQRHSEPPRGAGREHTNRETAAYDNRRRNDSGRTHARPNTGDRMGRDGSLEPDFRSAVVNRDRPNIDGRTDTTDIEPHGDDGASVTPEERELLADPLEREFERLEEELDRQEN